MAKTAQAQTAPKVLFYDIDRGFKALYPDARIEEIFGFKPRRFIHSKTLRETFDKLHTLGVIKSHDILGDCEEEIYIAQQGIQIEVLDSVSEFQRQKKNEVKDASGKVTLPGWGEIGEAVEDVITKMARTDNDVIIIGHTKTEEDSDKGILRHIPALSGRMADQIARHFDLVMYTRVQTHKESGSRRYMWQILADESRAAKCRIEPIALAAEKADAKGMIPQDFTLLFNLAKDYPAIKILILGEAGTGKTYSLRTLATVTGRVPRALEPKG
jgi:hypothetical protein